VIPTTFDRTLAPEGVHIMSLFTQWVPAEWSQEPHTQELEAYAGPDDRLLRTSWRRTSSHRSCTADIVGPYQMEHEYGLIGGNIFHGELSLEQLFHMRPAPGYADYRTPIAGLYYGSSATHAAAACAASRAGRRPGRRSVTPSAPTRNDRLRHPLPPQPDPGASDRSRSRLC
jgi:phytoene dehydrogenase-like protein